MADLLLPNARPYGFKFSPATTALLIIDMQRDFLDPDGFGSIQCGDPEIFASVRKIVPIVQRVLERSRAMGLHVIHTREGHRPELTDLPTAKRLRQISAPAGHHSMAIGDQGPMGRLLVRGEYGHDIIDELAPLPGELVVDKPGKGSFWGTSLHRELLARGITHLLLAGVTTECCVTTTLRECNDRGYQCCLLADCTDGFDAQMVTTAIDTICSQDGLFGYVGHSTDFLAQVVNSKEPFSPPSTPPLHPSTHTTDDSLPSIRELQQRYRNGLEDPVRIVHEVFDRIEKYQKIDPAVWINIQSRKECVAAATAMATKYNYCYGQPAPRLLPPLFGIPFGVKDSIDVADVPTTAACESYTYTPSVNATAVQHLLDAGAIYIGKLNLDQLATGLSGCRSPFGTPHSIYSAHHISGGSSSGSAVAVGAGLVSFALATDTAGSGRVPAAFNGVVGFKPTRGTISTRGLVPACPSLDCISIMTPSLDEARTIWLTIAHHDPLDPFAKTPSALPTWHVDFRGPQMGGFRFAIPPSSILEAACSKPYRDLFAQSVATLQRSCGGTLVEIDYTPFQEATDLLYDATLVHERVAAIGPEFLRQNLHTLHPTTQAVFRRLIAPAAGDQAPMEPWMVFRDKMRQAECARQAREVFDPLVSGGIDFLFMPTAPCHPTIEEMRADPVALNSRLGTFTHSANVLDLCGVNVPAGWVVSSNEPAVRLPFGVTFLGGMGYDGKILDLAGLFVEKTSGGGSGQVEKR